MKKMICLMMAVLLCCSLVLPAMAAEGTMIPSQKFKIKAVTVSGEDVTGSFVATSIPEAKDGSTDISQEQRDSFIAAYDALSNGSTNLPIDGDFIYYNMVLLSIAQSAADGEALAAELAKQGVTLTAVLELPDSDSKMAGFALKNGAWEPVVDVKVTGSGVVTCVLEEPGPVVFVSVGETEGGDSDGDNLGGGGNSASIYVPSITYKPAPVIIDVTSNIQVGGVPVDNDEIDACVVATSVSQAREGATDISDEESKLITQLYEELSNGTMALPLDKEYIIRDLIDVNFRFEGCRRQEGHAEKLENLKEEGVTLTVTFEMNLGKNVDLVAMSYQNGQWIPVKSVKNNGDNTVTLVLEDMGPVAFAVSGTEDSVSPWTGDMVGQNLGLWVTLMVVCAAGVVVLLVLKKKRS